MKKKKRSYYLFKETSKFWVRTNLDIKNYFLHNSYQYFRWLLKVLAKETNNYGH